MPNRMLTLNALRDLAAGANTRLGDVRANSATFKALALARREEARAALAKSLPEAPPAVSEAIAELPDNAVAKTSSAKILKDAIGKANIAAEEKKRLTELLRDRFLGREREGIATDEDDIAAAPSGDATLKDVPELVAAFESVKVVEIGKLAGLSDAKIEKVLGRVPSLAALNDQRITTLVIEGGLRDNEAKKLGAIAGLSQVLGGDTEAATRVVGTRFGALRGEVTALTDILKVDEGELGKAVVGEDAAGQDPVLAAGEGRALRRRIEARFPNEGMTVRLASPQQRVLQDALTPTRQLLENEPGILVKDPDTLELTDAEKTALRKVQATVNSYPGMGLGEVATGGGAARDIAKKIGDKVAVFDKFLDRNAGKDLLHLDFAPGSKDMETLDFSGLNAAAQAEVMATVKARARTFRLTGNVEQAAMLMQGGAHSAMMVGEMNASELASRSGLDIAVAGTVVAAARDMRLGVGGLVASLVDELRWRFPDNIWTFDPPEDVTDGLRKLQGYEDLFGQQSFCDCGHCDSILSPAAYFVDLMNFVDTHVTAKEFFGPTADHALKLQNRRPDLWTLPLTCDNTHTLIPTLDVINGILETGIATRVNPGIDTSNRSAVRELVYSDTLAPETESFVTPFDIRVATADSYISAFDTDRLEVVELVRSDAAIAETSAAALALSTPAYLMLVTARTGWTYLRKLYRMSIPRTGDIANPFDVQEILPAMEISRADFGELVATKYVTNRGAVNIRIKSQKRSSESVQNDIEKVSGMTNAALDRAHRFWRLRNALDWDITTLDLALDRAGGTLNDAAINALVRTDRTARAYGLDIEEAMVLTGEIPVEAVGGEDLSLMDRLFNRLPEDSAATRLPAPALQFVHPGLRDDASLPDAGPNDASFVAQRLRLGLKIDDSDLLELIVGLAPALGIDTNAAAEAARGFPLSNANLTLLLRHALLARALGADVDELFLKIGIATGGAAIETPAQLADLLALDERLSNLPYDLDAVAALLGISDDALADAATIAATLREGVAADEALSFAPTVFAFLDGVTETQSRAIVEANAVLFDEVDRDMLRLKPAIGLTPVIAPPPAGFPAGIGLGDLQAALEGFNIRAVLPARLAAALELDEDKLDSLLALAGADLDQAAVLDAFFGGASAALEAEIAKLGRALLALDHKAVLPANIDFVAANKPLFSLGNVANPLTRDAVIRLGAYVAALAAASGDPAGGAAVDAVLAAYVPATGFAAADTEQLALATGADWSVVRVFEAGTVLPDAAPLALDRLRRVIAFANDRGLGADAMALIANPDPESLAQGAESLVAALRLKIGDEESFVKTVEKHEDALRGKRRDALTDYMIRQSAGRFTSVADLYAYYLIDPEMEGCARTSWVVAAIGSVQTYVHRILLNLERDRRDAGAADHVSVSPSRIPQDEWDWRRNYRVWEANRKVFLWPENYMQPSLRDNKTPQFVQLEQTLLQQDLNEQTVQDAYAAYLKGFEEVASLRIAGAYHEHSYSGARDVLHVFGCTAEDPPNYYYWTVENVVFSKLVSDRRISYSARRKIDLSIPARDVSPFIYNNRLHLFWVEITTQPDNKVEDGESKFVGYRHTHKVKYSSLRLDGSWTPPQEIHLGGSGAYFEGGLIRDFLTIRTTSVSQRIPYYSAEYRHHSEYLESYTLTAPAANRVYPALRSGELCFNIGTQLAGYKLDLFERKAVYPGSTYFTDLTLNAFHVAGSGSTRRIYEQSVDGSGTLYKAHYNALFDTVKSREALIANIAGSGYHEDFVDYARDGYNLGPGDLGASIAAVNDPTARVVVPISDWPLSTLFVQKDTDVSFYSHSFDWGGREYEARRIGTTLTTELSRILFYDGVAGLLAKETQKDLAEKTHLVTSRNYRTKVVGTTSSMDFTGPLGTYYREIFMYIPALLADHQNARGDYAAAQAWYAKIFDPTAEFAADVDLSSLTASQRKQAERDRVWQYLEFEGLRPPSLRAILTDEDAQEAYRKDPFNPYAIARLRLSAFQKNAVMRYVQNLIDWGDSLFRQFTRESVDEAHVLYDLARQILGPRPTDAGDCGEGKVVPRSYQRIKPHMEAGQDFLIEVETVYISGYRPVAPDTLVATTQYVAMSRNDALRADIASKLESKIASEIRFDNSRPPAAGDKVEMQARGTTEKMLGDDLTVREMPDQLVGKPMEKAVSAPVAEKARYDTALRKDGIAGRQMTWRDTGARMTDRRGVLTPGWRARGPGGRDMWRPDDFVISAIRQIGPAFCVPRNKDLLALWDRVEDRLYKINNCLNLDGERVDLALFAPEIDPNALVRARAAGLSLADILGAGAGNLPPYRFSYLIGKAREYVGLVQGFGSKLQGAMEKRDGEELAQLRMTHATNMQNLVTRIREYEITSAKAALEDLKRRKTAVEYRQGYYDKNLSEDLLPWERTQQVLTHGSTVAYTLGAVLGGTSGVLHLIPQLGSPFAMKYGGHELGNSLKGWSKMFSDTAKLMDVLGKSAGLEAKFERRRSDWTHQSTLDGHELKQIEKKIEAAEIRVSIAERALENHKKAIEQQEEVMEFYENKFTGLALYTWMASTLQGIYRSAFNAAHSMAKLAEAAYRFERPQDGATLLAPTYWEAGQAGLLAGERLAVDLVEMEKRFIETNNRVLEISQPFSMAQLDPAALMALKETGEAELTVPEFAFDLLYPGHYRRRIRSARLSIACVTGPYVNIPATLTLTAAKMRPEPTTDGAAGLVDSQLRHTVTIATSTAQNDAGVFDFSFADPRYMPFEGAGAVETTWRVTLPKTFRPFDYDTINDVILHVSYTAESDGVLRERVESTNAALQGALMKMLSDTPLPRAYSFRQEFSTVFHLLRTGPLGTANIVTLDNRALPLALQGRAIDINRAVLLLKPSEGLAATGTEVVLNGTTLSGFAALPDFPGYRGTDATAALAAGLIADHNVAIGDAGDLAPAAGAPGALAEGALEDMVLYVELALS